MMMFRKNSGQKCLQHLKNSVQILWILLTEGGKRNMVDLYCALIIAGRRTIDTVPKRYQDAVREELAAIGLDENGNPITAE